MRSGVIDIGSYSVKMIIAEEVDGQMHILESLKNIVPIGKPSFLKGHISQDAINLTIQVLDKYKEVLKQYGVERFRVIATTAVREARNKDIFLDAIHRRTGLTVEILNVGDVVYYIDGYIAHKLRADYSFDANNVLIAELGAGSLDVSMLRKGYALMNIGLSVGTLHFKQLFNSLEGTFEEISEAIQEFVENEFNYLKRALPSIRVNDIILIDENISYLSQLLPRQQESEALYSLSREDCSQMLSRLSHKTGVQIAEEYNLPEDIAETIFPYVLVLEKFFTLAEDIEHLYLVETSLSEAILASALFKLEQSKRFNRADQLEAIAKSMCHQYKADTNHAKYVADVSKTMFDALSGFLGLTEDDFLYLNLAAYLHDIGMFIHNRSHHKHSEYIISSLNLFRLTEDEIDMIACIARYHRRSLPLKSHYIYNRLPKEKQVVVQKLSAILRMANALDRAHKQKSREIDVEFVSGNNIKVHVHTMENFLLETADFKEKKKMFEEISGVSVDLFVHLD